MKTLEDILYTFKGDPLISYYMAKLSRGQFMELYNLRKKRLAKNPGLDSLLG